MASALYPIGSSLPQDPTEDLKRKGNNIKDFVAFYPIVTVER